MEAATSVIAMYSDSENGALSILRAAKRTLTDEGVALIGAAIVTLEGKDGSVRLKIDPQIEPGTGDGTLVKETLFPESVREGPAVGRQADAAASYYRSIGAESNLLKELGENLAPNGAALVVLIREDWVHDVERALNSPSLSRFVLHSEVSP